MTTDNTMPSSADISDFYDVATHVLTTIWGDSFHVGYWLSDDDDSSDRQAVERTEELLTGKLGASSGDRVLDLGCGIGAPAFRLAQVTGAEVLGVSIDRGQIDEANRRARALGVEKRVSFELADALELPYADDSFDAAWAIESLIHMDRPPALRELGRVVRPGGRIVISDLLEREPLSDGQRDLLESMALSPVLTLDAYRKLVEESGLEVVELTDVSEHTHRTHARMADSARRHYDELVRLHGAEAAEVLGVMLSPVELGIVVAVLRSPGA
ncbi:methyltransferase domain-containing protein [Streptosporangium carneum]|uniref:Methyltransferase type 11 n=1 Tax=Streptosporangium carneum TaxID=47481 RepID=A0A9W6HYC6_9ACTN|nr:methyltransferase domain-containing protein [Streptosporangium carneum]GLK08298.1 methyltransferase type 11 [Streptosporangium carneum]